MTTTFTILTVLFVITSVIMVLIILVQRPQGGGLASAFGGASGAGGETVFGGRVGDALTWMTVVAFTIYLFLAIALNIVDHSSNNAEASTDAAATTDDGMETLLPVTDSTGQNVPVTPVPSPSSNGIPVQPVPQAPPATDGAQPDSSSSAEPDSTEPAPAATDTTGEPETTNDGAGEAPPTTPGTE